MIDREAQSLLAEYKNRLAAQGISWEMITKTQSEDEIMKSIREDAESRIKNSLVIDKIAKEEKITLAQEDITKNSASLVQHTESLNRKSSSKLVKTLKF